MSLEEEDREETKCSHNITSIALQPGLRLIERVPSPWATLLDYVLEKFGHLLGTFIHTTVLNALQILLLEYFWLRLYLSLYAIPYWNVPGHPQPIQICIAASLCCWHLLPLISKSWGLGWKQGCRFSLILPLTVKFLIDSLLFHCRTIFRTKISTGKFTFSNAV